MAANFNHPFEPYEIQHQFMTALYQCLEEGKVGVFESPTGTGKSLSLICGSLTWLRDYKRKQFELSVGQGMGDHEEPDWIVEHGRRERQNQVLHRRQDLEARLQRISEKEERLKKHMRPLGQAIKRQKPSHTTPDVVDEAAFVLDDYESDDGQPLRPQPFETDDSSFSVDTQALMAKLGMSLKTAEPDDDIDDLDEQKIFYCSRTHSQLTQFANELRRVHLPPAIPPEPLDFGQNPDGTNASLEEGIKQVTLASRKNLCIHSKVSRLSTAAAVNERCLELQDAKTSKEHRCPHLPNKQNESAVNEFRDHALAKIRDIEDLGALGKKLGICPYYASRAAVKSSEIVTLPYPLLLQKSAREALGISLQDHVIIIDEAHNLMDAIAGMYSVTVTLSQLDLARSQLMVYLQKFRNRLKGKNRVYVTQTVRLLDSLIAYLKEVAKNRKKGEVVVNASELTAGQSVDQINLYKLSHYLQEAKLARKVDGYISYAVEQSKRGDASAASQEKLAPVLMHVQSFLLTLMNPSEEGRFFATTTGEGQDVELRYMLLDPTNHFKEIVEQARAVVLAGGTMSPMNDYTQHLFSYLDPSRMTTLSCGHIIPDSSLLACPVTAGPSGREFDFTFESRMSETTVMDLGRAILSFAQTIPDGFVIFFPSYAYLEHCIKAWQVSRGSDSQTIWQHLHVIKPVFKESQSRLDSTPHRPAQASTTDSVLTAYSTAVTSGQGRGAFLFAVIGGSLSEGINFSDDLGRGVAVVGLPFANPHSAEWKAKMEFISAKQGKEAAKDFYTNTCMRAVNQAVGRAIRHKGDYAAILLLDRRYGTTAIQDKLPRWIRNSLRVGVGTQQAVNETEQFFKGKAVAGTPLQV